MKTISIVLYNRPDYTKQVLQALDNCIGIDQYYISIFIEPGCQEVIDIANQFNSDVLKVNEKRLGCPLNTLQSIEASFASGSEYNIHIEDDTVLSRDALLYFEWAKKYESDKSVWTVTAYNRDYDCGDNPEMVMRRQWFTCWGWATWKDRWQEMKGKWGQYYRFGGWGRSVLQMRKDRYEIFPCLSRCQNIGAENGLHVRSPKWHRAHHFCERVAGNDICVSDYFESNEIRRSP